MHALEASTATFKNRNSTSLVYFFCLIDSFGTCFATITIIGPETQLSSFFVAGMRINTWVTDALHDWGRQIARYQRSSGRGRPVTDEERGRAMYALSDIHGVGFDRWSMDDVIVFYVRAYSEELLLHTVVKYRPSEFLRALYALWRPPSISAWVRLLRRICTLGSFRLFVSILRLNHFQDDKLSDLAQALFIELPTYATIFPPAFPNFDKSTLQTLPRNKRPFGEDLLESIVAAFVRRPHDISCSRLHARDILALTEPLGPREVGAACRRLLMFLARPSNCRCDDASGADAIYAPRAPECRCPRKLAMDNRKEYARALFFAIFSETDWPLVDKEEFLIEACKHRFSAVVYKELAICLDAVEPGNEPAPNPEIRPYTVQELKDCYNMTHSLVQHAGCAEVRPINLPLAMTRTCIL